MLSSLRANVASLWRSEATQSPVPPQVLEQQKPVIRVVAPRQPSTVWFDTEGKAEDDTGDIVPSEQSTQPQAQPETTHADPETDGQAQSDVLSASDDSEEDDED